MHPIRFARVAAILDQPLPGFTGFNGFPQVLKNRFGHAGVAEQAMGFTHDLVQRVATHLHEGLIGVGDSALQIRARDKHFIISQLV